MLGRTATATLAAQLPGPVPPARHLGRHLRPGGVFALWSNDPPDHDFLAALRTSFTTAAGHTVSFWNFLIDDDSKSTIYVAGSPLN